jgi:hypothetical protein
MANLQTQVEAQRNIAKADAVHDLGQSGRVGTDDLPYCRLALGDMLQEDPLITIPSPSGNVKDPNFSQNCLDHMNKGLAAISGDAVTSTSGSTFGTYERHYANVVFPAGYQQISFQDILTAYKQWEDAGKPGERPTGWLDYTGFRNAETQAQDLAELQTRGIDKQDIPVGADYLRLNPASSYGSLEITWNQDDSTYQEWDMYNDRNQRVICDFIIKYLYPGRNSVKKGVFVFDANAGSIKDLFDSLDQISSEINPMVLADSAGTCMHQLGKKGQGRNAYCFPYNRDGTAVFDTAANVHTSNFTPDPRIATQFYFIRSNDEDGDPIEYLADTYNVFTFGFVISFTNPGEQPVVREWQVPFSSNGPSSGPSVPYLGEVIATIRKSYYQNPTNTPGMIAAFKAANPVPSLGSIMNITSQITDMMGFLQQAGVNTGHICLFVERLAMDVKKCGDWEQIRSVNASMNTCPTEVGTAMMCTGDFLCSAKARLDGLNGVWHNEGQGGATGWKLQLFRSPDLSDPNMAEAITIVDLAKQVLPLLQFTAKDGPHNVYQRLVELRDKTLFAVQLYRGKLGDPAPLVANEDPIPAEPTAFTDIFAAVCLANVCASANTRSLVLEKNEELRAAAGDNLIALGNTATQAIIDFTQANQNNQLPQFVQTYQANIETWRQINDQYASLLPTFINVLVDLGFTYEAINNLTSNSGDIDPSEIDALICNADAQVIIDSNKLNPDFTCGDVFHYVYEWITIVGAKQGYLHSVILPEIKVAMDTLNVVMQQYANEQAMKTDVVAAKRAIGDAYNSVVNLLKTGNDFFKSAKRARGSDSYKKAADMATNFDDADFSNIAKNALLISTKVPPSLGRRGNELNDLIVKYQAIQESVNLFHQLSGTAANTLWRQLLPRFYNRIGLPVELQAAAVGGTQKGGLGGPTDATNVDSREQEALQSYFDTLISTVIGYCRNATIQIELYEDLTVDNYMNVLETFPIQIESAFNHARAAFLKGCLVHPTANRLVYGPPSRGINMLQQYLNSPIMFKLSTYFGLIQNRTPIYYLPDFDAAMQQNIVELVANNSLEDLAQKLPDALGAIDLQTMATTLVFMTIIGDIWGPSLREVFENAYDNMYVSNVRRDLPPTESFFGQVVDYNNLMQLPYVAECVNKQIVLYTLAPQGSLENGKYASTTFVKSQLADILFVKNPMARMASMGRFNIWAEIDDEEPPLPAWAQDEGGEAVSVDTIYPRFTTEQQFTQDVMNDLANAAAAIVTRNIDDIDVSKLCYGICNIPNAYYQSDNSIVTGQLIDIAVEEANLLVAQSIQYAEQQGAAELARQQQLQSQREVFEQNQMILRNLVMYAQAFSQYYQLPTSLEQNAVQAQQALQLPAEQFSQSLPTMISVGAGKKKKTKKRQHKAKKTRGRKTRGRKTRGRILKKKGTKRNRKKAKKTRSTH